MSITNCRPRVRRRRPAAPEFQALPWAEAEMAGLYVAAASKENVAVKVRPPNIYFQFSHLTILCNTFYF